MTDATTSSLEKAYQLIQDDHIEEALGILRPLVAEQPDNADAWYLLSYAVSDPQEAHQALNHVMQLSPDHNAASNMLGTLHTEFPELAPVRYVSEPTPIAAPAIDFVDDDPFAELDKVMTPSTPPSSGDDDLFGPDPFAMQDPTFVRSGDITSPGKPVARPEVRRSSRVPLILAVAAVILVIGVVVVFLYTRSQTGNPTATTAPNADTLASATKAITDSLSSSGITNPSVKYGVTPIDNNTMQVSFCQPMSPNLQTQVNKVMDLVAAEAAKVGDLIGAAGIEISTCTSQPAVLYRAYVKISDIKTYVDGGSSNKKQFRLSWKTG